MPSKRASYLSPTGLLPSVVRCSRRLRLEARFLTPLHPCRGARKVPQPPSDNAGRLSRQTGLGSSPFARHYSGNSLLLSFPGGTWMFRFPPFTTLPYLFRQGWHALRVPGFPIRTSPDQCLLAAPRGFSQLATSFLISWRQGIRHVPLLPRPLLLKSASQVSSRPKLVFSQPRDKPKVC